MSFEKPSVRTKEHLEFPNLEHRTLFGGKVEAFMFGRHKDLESTDLGWSIRNLKDQDSVSKPENAHIVLLLRELAKQHGIKTIFAPSPSDLNGIIAPVSELKVEIDLSIPGLDLKIKRGTNADGVLLEKGTAYMMTSADCSTVVAENADGKIVAAHGGRNSIFNASNPSRKSLIENIATIFGGTLEHARIWTGFAISPGEHFAHDLDDEKHGETNLKRLIYLYDKFAETGLHAFKDGRDLDVMGVSYSFAKSLGIKDDNFAADTSFCTYKDVGVGGEYKWYSHRRQAEEQTDSPNARNMVLVIRK